MISLFAAVVFQLVITFKSVVSRFIGEESVAAGEKCDLTDEPTWIVDPIDGTMNFVHSFPHSCISLAVLYHKDIHIGIIYNPILDQMFTAKLGQGAFLNDKPIQASEETGIKGKGNSPLLSHLNFLSD
jgi:myo-inositol-1(or 4)-monophosphatase